MKIHFLIPLVLAIAMAPLGAQSVPPRINYQGRVHVDGIPFNGTGHFKFALVSPGGTITWWSNDDTSVAGAAPVQAVDLLVSEGAYAVGLGDASLPNMQVMPPAVFAGAADLQLRVWFDDGVHGSKLLNPDQPVASVGYAMVAAQANSLTAGAQISPSILAPAPIAGQVLSFDGVGLVWNNSASGGNEGGGFLLHGTNAYYNAGNVGIGTNQPGSKLEVRTGTGYTGFAHTDGATTLASYIGGSSSGASGAWFGTISDSPLHFYVHNAQPRMTLDRTGNIGIGTTSPSAPLDVSAKWLTPGTTGIPNIQLSGQNPTLAWVKNGLPRTSWIAHLGASDGLEFWERYQSGGQIGGAPGGDTGWVFKTRLDIDGSFYTVGNIDYGGRLSRLDTTEKDAATVRAADFNFGHSKRHGKTGRAFVDVGDALVVNYANDWDRTVIGGTVTEVTTLQINGGADLAEPFAMSQKDVLPGAVVVIDEQNPGKLRLSSTAYDKKVAGIVSGARGIHPGISMTQAGKLEPGENVSLSGRVHVNANNLGGRIEPGDLLTTSDIPGEAMKAADHHRAQGAILGKAMTRLDEIHGTVLVLVTLQ